MMTLVESEMRMMITEVPVCTQTPPPPNITITVTSISAIEPTTVANPTSRSTNSGSTNGPDSTSQPTSWSSTLNPVTINPFTSPIGPVVPISASPLDVSHSSSPLT